MKILEVGEFSDVQREFAKIFGELGHKTDILTWLPFHKKTDIKSKTFFIKNRGSIIRSLDLLKMMYKLRKKYDLFHCNYAFQTVIFAYLLKKIGGPKYIAHVRGTDIRETVNHPIFGYYIKRGLKDAEAIWCSTPDLKKYAKPYNKNIYWIPNVVDLEIFKPRKTKLDLRGKHELAIFMPSRQIWQHKGNDKMIYAFKEILKKKDAILHLIEWGEDIERSRKLIEELEIGKNVIWHKMLRDYKKLAEFYNSADVIWDDFSNLKQLDLVALEAMSCNKPLIIKKIGKNIYPKKPPVIEAENIKTIVKKTLNINKYNLKKQINKQRKWIKRYSSFINVKKRIKNLLIEMNL